MRVSIALGIVLLLVGASWARAQGSRAEPPQTARLDPRLKRLAGTRPDTVVSAWVRFQRSPGKADLDRLEDAGLRVGTVSGVFVAVRGRARDYPAVARISAIQYIQMSRPLRTQPVPPRARTSPRSGGIE